MGSDSKGLSESALKQCSMTLRRGSKSFSMAAWLLPRQVRVQATVFYAFCREADDAIDEGEHPGQELERLQHRVESIYAGRPQSSNDEVLAYVLQLSGVPQKVLDALLEGFAWDLESRRYVTTEQLLAYCVRVASTVGVAMCHFMGVRDTTTLARACDLGVAMQLTNIARDIGEDWGRGRVYVPVCMLERYGSDLGELGDSSGFARFNAARELLALADQLYQKAKLGIDRLPANCRPAIRAAAQIYLEIGNAILSTGPTGSNHRAFLGFSRKSWLLVQAFLQSIFPHRALSNEELRLLYDDPLPEARILFSQEALANGPTDTSIRREIRCT